MRLRFRMSILIAMIAIILSGCSDGADNTAKTATPITAETLVTSAPTDCTEQTVTLTPTATITVQLDNCLERMQPFEGEEKKGYLSVLGILDGHKIYGCTKDSLAGLYVIDDYDGAVYLKNTDHREFVGWPVWSKDENTEYIDNVRNRTLDLSCLEDDDYIYIAATASATKEILTLAVYDAYASWLEEGNTHLDWCESERGTEAKIKAQEEAASKAIAGFREALYREGCSIVDMGYYQVPYATVIISKKKLSEIRYQGGKTFYFLFYLEGWLRYAEENKLDWVR